MNTVQVEDEFVAVRVQDPRMQNEGSWNSYVDYKIFLHTNSKAFTAKTSCVRRRYSEFVWLRKKLQKNAGLVPVPELPGKSFFSFSNDDFLERRRKGLQVFLDKVVHMTVCLSDSQLHLFLQTQLPVCHIQDCVQGHTPYTVTDAILTYASSNWGLAQAQEDDCIKEPSLTVSYESMESPAPHQPCTQINKEIFTPELLSCGDPNPAEGLLEHHDEDTAQLQHKEKPSVRISQENNRLQAVVESRPAGVSFYVGDDMESLSLAEQSQQRSRQVQTPVEVHSVPVAGFEEDCTTDGAFEGCNKREEEETLDSEEKFTMEVKDDLLEENVDAKEGPVSDLSCVAEFETSEPDNRKHHGSVSEDDELDVCAETDEVSSVLDVVLQVVQDLDLVGTKDESEEDCHSLPSSNESIIKVSEDEGVCDEVDDSIQAANGYMETPPDDVSRWSEVEASSRSVLDLQMDGCSVEREDISTQEALQYVTSVDLHSTVASGDWTESGDFSVLETSGTPALADSKCAEQEALSSLSLDTSEDMYEVQVR